MKAQTQIPFAAGFALTAQSISAATLPLATNVLA